MFGPRGIKDSTHSHGNRRDLALEKVSKVNRREGAGSSTYNHSVESKAGHGRDTDTLASSMSVEDLGGNDPTQRTASAAEGEIVQPGHDDEAPLSASVGGYARRELCKEDRGDNERDHITKVAQYERPTTASLVDEEDGAELSDQRNDRVDALIFERVVAGDANLSIDCDRIILDCRDTCHLD